MYPIPSPSLLVELLESDRKMLEKVLLEEQEKSRLREINKARAREQLLRMQLMLSPAERKR